VGGFFLRGYISWKNGEDEGGRELLIAAQKARGEDWKPKSAVAEGDVAKRMHTDETPFSRFWEHWDGELEPDAAFGPLGRFLEGW